MYIFEREKYLSVLRMLDVQHSYNVSTFREDFFSNIGFHLLILFPEPLRKALYIFIDLEL
jgi:hypothetical protein